MAQKRKGSKGTLIWDVSASHQLIRTAINVGFKVKSIIPSDKELSDRRIAKKYAKGRFPVCSGDKDAWKEMVMKGGATSIIYIENPRKEDFGSFRKTFKKFLMKHTSNTLRGSIWSITAEGIKKEKVKK